MSRVFGDLVLSGPGDPLQQGSFFFEKGNSKNFHYKNLSGGEKAAFDIILDVIVKRVAYDDTVYCLDEPEAHMHTRLQALFFEGALFFDSAEFPTMDRDPFNRHDACSARHLHAKTERASVLGFLGRQLIGSFGGRHWRSR
jgi:hypothetical protein